jgi:hypothetical protein
MKNKDNTELDNNRRINFELSKQRQQEKRRINQEIIKDRHAEAKAIRLQSYHNDIRKQEIINAYATRNKEKKSKVRMEEEKAQRKIREMQEKRLKEFKRNYESRIEEELEKIKKREKDLTNMEKEESELIRELQNTQQVQKSAFNELEAAIKLQSSNNSSPKPTSPSKDPSPQYEIKESQASKT